MNFSEVKCVYCLKKLSRDTKSEDHVFPKNWRPIEEAGKYVAWKVPACVLCNQNLGRVEEDLFPRLAACVKDTNGFMWSVRWKGIKNLMPLFASDQQSFKRKNAAFIKFTNDLSRFEEHYNEELISNPTRGDRSPVTIRFPSDLLKKITFKFACSLEYELRKNYLGKHRQINFWLYEIAESVNKDSQTSFIDFFLEKNGESASQGETFKVRYAANKSFTDQVIYRIDIWQSYQFYLFLNKRKKDEPLIQQIPVNSLHLEQILQTFIGN